MRLSAQFFSIISGLVLALTVQADNLQLPDIGESSGTIISPEQEYQIGVEFLRRIRLAYALQEDPEVNAWITTLGERLVANSDNPAQSFTFFVINDSAINAFAAPGGFIGVNTGLILAAESESELASVLSHEIAHITQRHLARAYEAQDKLNIPSIAGVIAAILIGSQSGDAGLATLAASQAATLQAQINFTRSNENEADYIGIQTLARSGFDPGAMASFFERLQQASRYYSRPPEFLSTHPVTTARIANARDRSAGYGYKQIPDSMEFLLMREKLRVLSLPRHDVLKRYENALQTGQYSNEAASRYGYAIALMRRNQYFRAREHIDWLLKQEPERSSYLILNAEYHIATRQSEKALEIYQHALKIYPQDHALTVLYAQTLLDLGQANKSREVLQNHMRGQSTDAELYKLRARAEGRAGYPVEAHLSMAEYHYLNGQTHSAIRQLDQALQLPNLSFYQSSKIEARRNYLQQILQAESKR